MRSTLSTPWARRWQWQREPSLPLVVLSSDMNSGVGADDAKGRELLTERVANSRRKVLGLRRDFATPS